MEIETLVVMDLPPVSLSLCPADFICAQRRVPGLCESVGQQPRPSRGAVPDHRRHRGLPGVRRRVPQRPVPPGGGGLRAGGGEG